MNEALTDEYEITNEEERRELSPHLYWPGMIYMTVTALALSPMSHLFAYSHTETHDAMYMDKHRHTDILYILEVFSVDWCWGETVIREKQERPGMLSSLVSSLGFDILEYRKWQGLLKS